MAVHEISCPHCGETRGVNKRDIGEYFCTACETAFRPADTF